MPLLVDSMVSCRRTHPEVSRTVPYDRNAASQRAPTADELNLLARHRQEPPSDDGSSDDEGVPKKNSGWVGVGPPLQEGVGYTSGDHCDGQNLASPGRWPIENRRYPLSLTYVGRQNSSWRSQWRRWNLLPLTLPKSVLSRTGSSRTCTKRALSSGDNEVIEKTFQPSFGFWACSSGKPKIRKQGWETSHREFVNRQVQSTEEFQNCVHHLRHRNVEKRDQRDCVDDLLHGAPLYPCMWPPRLTQTGWPGTPGGSIFRSVAV